MGSAQGPRGSASIQRTVQRPAGAGVHRPHMGPRFFRASLSFPVAFEAYPTERRTEGLPLGRLGAALACPRAGIRLEPRCVGFRRCSGRWQGPASPWWSRGQGCTAHCCGRAAARRPIRCVSIVSHAVYLGCWPLASPEGCPPHPPLGQGPPLLQEPGRMFACQKGVD